jgi:hypothetical protein
MMHHYLFDSFAILNPPYILATIELADSGRIVSIDGGPMQRRNWFLIGAVVLFGNVSAAGLFPGQQFSVGEAPSAVAVGDFDRDGQQDLVTANSGSDDVVVLLNQGLTPVPSIAIDIKPGSFPNSVNPHSRGAVPVAILGSNTFDVADVDVTTLAFGPNGASIAHLNGHLEDTNFDGVMDLVVHFETRDTGIVCNDESATLTGETLDGQPFEGSDSIRTVGCRASRRSLFQRPGENSLMSDADGRAALPQKR